ncbi:MAG TPA: T9SS type A sorting domain-containing protein, partial [Candidatus Kapabacteria bacterium]|nr:T9SS type A sorting domain-containing protein [Candidatus Kapabacteria bacterium]
TTLNFSLENNARVVTVSVCDIQGSVIKSILTDSPLNAGSQAMYFDTSSLANGVYIVKIEVDGKVHTTKLNVVR